MSDQLLIYGKPFKPLLAAQANLMLIDFPAVVSPKIDGLRCIIVNGVPVSRSLKPIRNAQIKSVLTGIPHMLDGELIVADGNFQQSTTAVMRESAESDWEYHVFDLLPTFASESGPFSERLMNLRELFESAHFHLPEQCKLLEQSFVFSREELEEVHKQHVADGYEGTMVRSPKGIYKFGRSTAKEGILVKLKQFSDAEAVIIGFEELMHNDNEAVTNALGLTERSSHKENKRASGKLGAFVLRSLTDQEITFKCGTGLTDDMRVEFWKTQDDLLGQLVKYKFFDFGIKQAPRHPVFLGIRHPDDIGI